MNFALQEPAALDLLVPGFDDPVHDAQRVFRRLLGALARPGTAVALDGAYDGFAGLSARTPRGLAAALLALADADTPVWFDPACAPELRTLLRFHAGAPLAATPNAAAFAVLQDPVRMPALADFDWGTPEYPDRSTTLFVVPAALDGGTRVRLTGPGIAASAQIAPRGLPADFWRQREAMRREFPCGVDVFFCAGAQVVGLPRSTRAELLEG